MSVLTTEEKARRMGYEYRSEDDSWCKDSSVRFPNNAQFLISIEYWYAKAELSWTRKFDNMEEKH